MQQEVTLLTINSILNRKQIKIDANKASNNSNSKTKIYNFWHRRFAYLEAIKLRKLHKVTTF